MHAWLSGVKHQHAVSVPGVSGMCAGPLRSAVLDSLLSCNVNIATLMENLGHALVESLKGAKYERCIVNFLHTFFLLVFSCLQICLRYGFFGFRPNNSRTNVAFFTPCRSFHDGAFTLAMPIRSCRRLRNDRRPNGLLFIQIEAPAAGCHHLSHGVTKPAPRGWRLVGHLNGHAARCVSLRRVRSRLTGGSSRAQGNPALYQRPPDSCLRHRVRSFSQRLVVCLALRRVPPLHSRLPSALCHRTVDFGGDRRRFRPWRPPELQQLCRSDRSDSSRVEVRQQFVRPRASAAPLAPRSAHRLHVQPLVLAFSVSVLETRGARVVL